MKSDFTYLHGTSFWINASKPLRQAFTKYMKNKNYGMMQTVDAFHHFSAGFNAKVAFNTGYSGEAYYAKKRTEPAE